MNLINNYLKKSKALWKTLKLLSFKLIKKGQWCLMGGGVIERGSGYWQVIYFFVGLMALKAASPAYETEAEGDRVGVDWSWTEGAFNPEVSELFGQKAKRVDDEGSGRTSMNNGCMTIADPQMVEMLESIGIRKTMGSELERAECRKIMQKKLLQIHPDKGGNLEKTQDLLEMKRKLEAWMDSRSGKFNI